MAIVVSIYYYCALVIFHCMSVHNRFGAVIAKVGVTIGQNCLGVEVIGVSVFGGDSCSGI